MEYMYEETLTNPKCREILNETGHSVPVHDGDTLCAKVPERYGYGQGVCFSVDKGSALIANNKLIGIISWWYYPCGRQHPTGFTRVSTYIDWINKKTNLSF